MPKFKPSIRIYIGAHVDCVEILTKDQFEVHDRSTMDKAAKLKLSQRVHGLLKYSGYFGKYENPARKALTKAERPMPPPMVRLFT